MLGDFDIWSNKIWSNFPFSKLQKDSGPQFALLSLFCKFCLLVLLDQYFLNTNDICL